MILDTFKSLKWADYFILALTDPRALARQIRLGDPSPLAVSFLIPVCAAASYIIAFSLLSAQSRFFYYKISYGLILLSILFIMQSVVFSSLFSMALEYYKVKGTIREIISLVNFAILPQLFLLPLVLIFTFLKFAPIFFIFLFMFLLAFWTAFITVLGISELHTLDFGKSMLVFAFPFLLFGVSGFFILLLTFANIAGLIFG